MYFEAPLAAKARKFFRLVLERYAFRPGDITIEVTTRCARGCAVCFRGPLGVKPADMPAELFDRILSELKGAYGAAGLRYLNFVGLGEPFCHPQLGQYLRRAAQALPGTELNVSTGLSPFDREVFAGLVRDGVLNRLSVSLDGLEPDGPYHRFSEEVRANLGFIKGLREKTPGFKLRVQTLITSRPAVEAAVRHAADAGAEEIQLMRTDLHAFGGEAPAVRPGFSEERAIVAAAAELAGSLGMRCRNNNSYNVFMDMASGRDSRCLLTDDHVFITAGGDVLPCFCLRGVKFGSLASQSLAEVCASAGRKEFYGRQAELCRGCDIYKKGHAS
jgi:MoaA/NifB/PqqE/SkfB family radical SAM enzyme